MLVVFVIIAFVPNCTADCCLRDGCLVTRSCLGFQAITVFLAVSNRRRVSRFEKAKKANRPAAIYKQQTNSWTQKSHSKCVVQGLAGSVIISILVSLILFLIS